jgi:hypothetical protein
VAERPSPQPTAQLDLGGFLELWPAVLSTIGDARLGACLSEARPVELNGQHLTLAFGKSGGFLRRQAEDTASRETLIEAIRTITGLQARLTFELRDVAETTEEEAAGPSDEEWVQRFKDEFAAEEIIPDDEEQQPGGPA